jgi:hypothetical protein
VGNGVAVGTGVAVVVGNVVAAAVFDGRFSVGTKVGDGFTFGLQPMIRALTATSTDHLLILKIRLLLEQYYVSTGGIIL